eukprot:CAMPEP_0177759192 /NCGR_PEP_ID=MMETSP0491_2-20121128/4600_1 /TAXON_ID=63592 /ORGANISM="Tetraselmis chuii, Strain PLY429" /LENGTH=68 /DNA_ID=CAMNT_0019275003 /DNA_START=228 /DNA_END=434 /DNA_ORIENTATION=-
MAPDVLPIDVDMGRAFGGTPLSSGREVDGQVEVALGVYVELGVSGGVGVQHDLFQPVRFATEEKVHSP